MMLTKPEKSEFIQQALVLRDECGFFHHPDFPKWDEGEPVESIVDWFKNNGGGHYVDRLEDSATEEMVNAWFDDYAHDCTPWQPTCELEGSFILSIHDTEEGPVALFFYPTKAEK